MHKKVLDIDWLYTLKKKTNKQIIMTSYWLNIFAMDTWRTGYNQQKTTQQRIVEAELEVMQRGMDVDYKKIIIFFCFLARSNIVYWTVAIWSSSFQRCLWMDRITDPQLE